jgi:aryl-alcohol dehydrogenase-like predicted oxidoreductase
MSRTFWYPASGSTDASPPGAYWYQMGTISGLRQGPADTDKAAMCGSAKNSSRSRTDNLLSAMSLSVGRGTDNPGQAAVAFVTRHPAVTSAIIGPRTMEHLDGYLAADGIELSTDVLDRIDQIVPPGVTINVADNMWHVGTTALDPAIRRR